MRQGKAQDQPLGIRLKSMVVHLSKAGCRESKKHPSIPKVAITHSVLFGKHSLGMLSGA